MSDSENNAPNNPPNNPQPQKDTTVAPVVIHARAPEPVAQKPGWWLNKFTEKLGNYELEGTSGPLDAHNKVIALLGGKEDSEASKALYKGCAEVPQFASESSAMREEFIKKLSELEKVTNLKKKEVGDPDPITLEELIGKDAAEAYIKACDEERASRSFRDAVFLSSTKTYEGKKWDKRLVLWVGGPSASGKSYATNDLLEKIAEEKNKELVENKAVDEPKTSENHVVSIDGGVEREVSQMRQLVLQIALARGYTGIDDLTKYDEHIKAKRYVKKAVIKSENKLNMAIPATFTNPFENLKGIAKHFDDQGENQVEQIYAQVREAPEDPKREIFKSTVAEMGKQRAFDAVNMEAADIKPNQKIKVESKEYKANHFERGVERSDARRDFFKEKLKHSNYKYYEITFDLVFAQKLENGELAKIEPPLPDGIIIKTNSRILAAYNNYIKIVPDLKFDLKPEDFTKKVWVKRTGKWNGNIKEIRPGENEIQDYICVSLAGYKVAQHTLEQALSFEESWNELNKDHKFEVNYFKSSIHKDGNPNREEINRKRAMPAALLEEIRNYPRALKANTPVAQTQLQPDSQPVLEAIAPNLALETLKNEASKRESGLNIKVTKEKKDSDDIIKSIKFESNNPHESKHVKFEAELTKKDSNNRVVYKIQPGHAGKNSSSTPEMKATYALLVKVAFETHFSNPSTQNNQFIISVLPNLGEKREEAFIEAIKNEAIKRNLDQAQIKLMVPEGKNFKEIPIPALATSRVHAAQRAP